MSSATARAVRVHLKAAKDAIAAGDAAAARAACKEALALDDASYDAWVFDGKAGFAAGDHSEALASYRTATACEGKGNHPAAWQGIAEAAAAAGDDAAAAEALEKLLEIAAGGGAPVPPEKRLDWTTRSAAALTRLGRWTDAGTRWAEVLALAGSSGEESEVVSLTEEARGAALTGAAECAMAEDAAAAKRSGAAAATAAATKAIITPSEQRAVSAAAEKAHAALPNPALENAVRALLAHTAGGGGGGGSGVSHYDPRLHGALLSRASARLTAASGAAGAMAAARDVLAEAEALVSMCGGGGGGGGAVLRTVRAAALEAAAALDLGWDAEEEGWEEQEESSQVSETEEEMLVRRVVSLVSPEDADHLSVHSEDYTVAVGAVWLRLLNKSNASSGAGAGARDGGGGGVVGRSGRSANLPGSAAAAAALPGPERAALLKALTDGDASSAVNIAAAAVTTAASAAALAAAAPPLGLGAAVLGWGALAETALMADEPSAALDAARRGLRAVRAARAAEATTTAATAKSAAAAAATAAATAAKGGGKQPPFKVVGSGGEKKTTTSTPSPPAATTSSSSAAPTKPPRMPAAERRMRLIAAEALLTLGQSTEGAAALRALTPPSPRTLRGLAAAAATAATSTGADKPAAAAESLTLLREAAALGPKAPRALAELGWAMLRAGGDGAETRARRVLERAAVLAGSGGGGGGGGGEGTTDVDASVGAPPDIAARLGIARWREARAGGEDTTAAAAAAAARGPGTPHAALLAAAASEGPWRAAAFAHLGLVYAAGGDAQRADKCHARALSLDPAEPTAGPAACQAALLADAADEGERGVRGGNDDDDSAIRLPSAAAAAAVSSICRKALEVSPRCLWAAVRLAPLAAGGGAHEEAAVALQAVLRASPSAAAAWEALGAAYDALNRHSAALKAYGRAQEMEETVAAAALETTTEGKQEGEKKTTTRMRVFAAVQSGRILQQMGQAREAVEAYEGALAASPGHTAALLGLAEAELSRALNAAKGGAPGRAAVAAERAAAAAGDAASGRGAPKRTALKLLGDAKLAAARVRDPRSGGKGGGDGGVRESQGAAAAAESAVQRGADVLRRSAAAGLAARRAYARVVALSPSLH